MKKVLFPILALVLALGLALPVAAHTEDEPLEVTLLAGQNINVGDVKVWNDGTNLYVQYVVTEDGWVLAETHLAVATSLDGIPQTKTGNPIPGKFEWSMEHDPWVTEYTYTIDLGDWEPRTDLYIAAHAVVVNVAEEETVTVVSDETDTWWAGATQSEVDAGGYIVPPSGATWNSAVLAWDHPAWWGGLKPPASKANFISAGADWIWKSSQVSLGESYTGDIVFFKKLIELPGFITATDAKLFITTDNGYYLYVNGNWSSMPDGKDGFPSSYGPTNFYYVSDGVNNLGGGTNSVAYETAGNVYPKDAGVSTAASYWQGIETWDISSGLVSGDNWLQIVAINEHAPPQGPINNPGALIYKAEISYLWWEETAWGEGLDFPGKNWAMYFEYHIQEPCVSGEVINGSFETPVVGTTQGWDIYDSGTEGLGWTVEWYDGSTSYEGWTRPTTAKLELHRGVLGAAYEGEQYAELDTDWNGPVLPGPNNEPASVKIYQDIDTCPDREYTLKYAWMPRSGTQNALEVKWGGTVVATHTTGSGWNYEELAVTATSDTTVLEFIETGPPDSLGMFLDAVSLVEE